MHTLLPEAVCAPLLAEQVFNFLVCQGIQDQASLNQFITVAVAEKVSALQTADFF